MLERCQLLLPVFPTTPYSGVPPYTICLSLSFTLHTPSYNYYTMELVNETAQRWRDWGYIYYIVDHSELYRHTHYLVLPKDSYVYKARIEQRIVWLAQIPIGNAVTQFLLHHGHAVVKPLPSVLQR